MGFNSAFNKRVKVEGYISLSYSIPKLINIRKINEGNWKCKYYRFLN